MVTSYSLVSVHEYQIKFFQLRIRTLLLQKDLVFLSSTATLTNLYNILKHILLGHYRIQINIIKYNYIYLLSILIYYFIKLSKVDY
jgi:hypothetical protein